MKFFICQKKEDFSKDAIDEEFLNSKEATSLIAHNIYRKELSNFLVYLYTYNNIYDEDSYVEDNDNEFRFVNGLFTIDESKNIDTLDEFFKALSDDKLILGNYQALKMDDSGNGYLKTSVPTIYPIFYYENESCIILSNEFKLIVDSVKEFSQNKFLNYYDFDYIDELFKYGELYKGDAKTTYSDTIFTNIKRILANDVVTFNNGSVEIEYDTKITAPEWFEEWYLDDKDSLYDWYYDKLLDYTEEFTKIISKKTTRVTAGITGGFDSRLTCMILAKILPKYDIEFIANTSGLDHHPDVIIGKMIVSALDLTWQSANYITKEDDDFRYFPQSFPEYAKVFYTTHGEMSSYNAPETFSRDVSDVHEFFQHGNDLYKHETVNSIKILSRWSSRRRLYVLDFYFPLFGTQLEVWFARLYDKYHPGEDYNKEFIYNILKRGEPKLLEIPFAFDSLPQVDVEELEFDGYYSTRHHEQPFLWDYQYVLDKLGPLFDDDFRKVDGEHENVLSKNGINSLDYFILKKKFDHVLSRKANNMEEKLIEINDNAFYPKKREFVDLKELKTTFYTTTHILRLMDFAAAADFSSFDELEKSCSFSLENDVLVKEDQYYEKLNNEKYDNSSDKKPLINKIRGIFKK